ncbi:hypothetical protein [Herpetosiphon sp. NSE202]|uniref:hypothetical protein n=1 Tax=Herpetosiphon sp. NSE202 TaxID=3351349 RepID=UPI00363C893D
MKTKSLVWYELRIIFGLSALLPALLLPLGGLLAWLVGAELAVEQRVVELSRAFELVVPLTSGLAVCHLMGVEREQHFAELRATYPENPWRLPLMRIGGALGVLALIVILSTILLLGAFGTFDLQRVVVPAFAPAILLMGLGLLISSISGSYWAATGVVMSYWFIELLTKGGLSGPIFLFERTWPTKTHAYATNRWLLISIGMGLLIATVVVSVWRRISRIQIQGQRPRVGFDAPSNQ